LQIYAISVSPPNLFRYFSKLAENLQILCIFASKMKKTLTYITIVMTALMAASYLISEPKHTGMSLKTVAKADDSLHRVSNALSPEQQQLL
jgi:hypothetical protein